MREFTGTNDSYLQLIAESLIKVKFCCSCKGKEIRKGTENKQLETKM